MTSIKTHVHFIHGWSVGSYVWQPLLDELQHRYGYQKNQLHCFDLPGYIKASLDTEHHNLDSISTRFADSMAKISLLSGPCQHTLVGWSLGSLIAIYTAMHANSCHSDINISGLVLINPTPCFIQTTSWQAGTPKAEVLALKKQLRRNTAATIDHFKHTMTVDAPAHIKEQLNQLNSDSDAPLLTALTDGLSILLETDLRECLSNIPQPCELFAGRHDAIIPAAAAEYLHQELPLSCLHKYDDGHLLPLTQSSAIATSVNKLCRSH